MKTVIRLGFLSFLSLVLFSCKKENTLGFATGQQSTEASITSNIFPFTNQPAETVLGKAQSVFHTGDVVIIYVPYGVSNDMVTSGTLTIKDASNNEVLNTYEMSPSTEETMVQLNVPAELRSTQFMFASFPIDETYAGKTVHIVTSLQGNKAVSESILENGFSIQP
jgi:hypothetical protein